MSLASKLLLLAAAGALGTLARFGLGTLARKASAGFPVGTLIVNGLGCLVFGAVWGLVEDRKTLRPESGVIVMVGFLGAFTTFSSYAAETAQMMRDGRWIPAALNVLAQNALGIACFFAGAALARGR